ncbi:MAG: DUF4097 family beta strand repeat protein [Clostridia bacterium]|nr:DUF4097 family beta strand repeat protein [Clostridia bacterium]
MNATVARIVDLLFEDMEENEEVRAIHDEVMNNCQERYQNLVQSGYSEDEAIGAVVESLKGMDEVLRDYPRKAGTADAFAKGQDASASGTDAVDWNRVRALQVNVRTADVTVERTSDRPTLELEQGTVSVLRAWVEGDTLMITQEHRPNPAANTEKRSGFFGTLSRLIGATVSFGDSDCSVLIRVPEDLLRSARIQTLSGDIRYDVPTREITLQSTSGDCHVELGEKTAFAPGTDGTARCGRLEAGSISGDLEVSGSFGEARLNTTSGDIDFRGGADAIRMNTVSGDIDAWTVSTQVTSNTVSGEIDLTLRDVDHADLQFNSVSGDIDLHLPSGSSDVEAKVKTRSGDIGYHNVSLRDSAPFRVTAGTVSGDVDITGG